MTLPTQWIAGHARTCTAIHYLRTPDFASYQQSAARTGGEITVGHPIVYPTLGLANEAGEVAGKVKKIFRDKGGVITDADRGALALELGDILWYLSELCTRRGGRELPASTR